MERKLYALFLRVPVSLVWIWGAVVNLSDVFLDPAGFDAAVLRWRYMFEEVWVQGSSLGLPLGTPYAPSQIPPNPYPWMAEFLQSYMGPNVDLVVRTMPLLELAIGFGLLLGFLTRPAALGGMAVNIMIFLASGHTNPGIARVNFLMLATEVGILLTSAGRTLGVDALLAKRVPRPPLRLW